MDFSIPEPRLDPPEPVTVATCAYCKEDIYDGDETVEFDGQHYHEDCFSDCAVGILMEHYGARRVTAGEDMT